MFLHFPMKIKTSIDIDSSICLFASDKFLQMKKKTHKISMMWVIKKPQITFDDCACFSQMYLQLFWLCVRGVI
jgi:hypothetical protein